MKAVPHTKGVDERNGLLWTVTIQADACPQKLRKALRCARTMNMKLSIIFPDDFPMRPPFVYITEPCFRQGTGHVLAGGAVCAEIMSLTDSPGGWRPVICAFTFIETLLHVIDSGSPVVESHKKNTFADEAFAREGYKRAVITHAWNV